MLSALPGLADWLLLSVVVAATLVALLRPQASARLLAATACVAALLVAIGLAGGWLTPPDNTYARVSPASGFWVLLFAFALLAADAISRKRFTPATRLARSEEPTSELQSLMRISY